MNAEKILELKNSRAKLVASSRVIMNEFEGKEIPADKLAELKKIDNDFDSLSATIDREERQLARERSLGEAQDPGKPAPSNEKLTAFRNHLLTGSQETLRAYNALQQDNPTQTGYLVAPEQFVQELIKEIADTTFMRQRATVLPPLKGAQSLGYPTRTSGITSGAWGTECAEVPEDTAIAVGKREFKTNPHTVLVKVSKTLIRNYANADAFIRGEFAEYFAGVYETAYMTGSGSGRPLGLFIASDNGIPTSRDISTHNTASEIKFDNLIEVQESIKEQYQPGCEWLFHRDATKQIRKLKSSDGQYIWQPSLQAGQPDLLLGKPVTRSEYVPHTFTTGLYVGLYGNLKSYWILDSLSFEIQVLNELYARNNQVGYMGRIETEGAPVHSAAFARVKLG
jgi:HK97 family phage major capsid protein